MFLTTVTFLIVLSILVFVHELGHFWTARKLGVKAEEFGIGFPPRLGGFYKTKDGKWKYVKGSKEVDDADDTIYSLNWIPLGGFVKIKGENGDEADDSDSFSSHPIWQRAIILSAGVSMNVVLAAVLFSIALMIGSPQSVEGLDSGVKISDQKIQIVEVLADSPAENAGFKMLDTIISINNQEFVNEEDLQNFVSEHSGEELNYKIKRGQEELEFRVTPEIIEETDKGGIGIAIIATGVVKYPFMQAVWGGIKTTFWMTWAIILAFFYLIKDLITGNGVSADLAGPIGIAGLTGQMARMGFVYLLQFTAMLSINLAVINFLPIPALDGGRVFFLIIEKIRRKPMNQEIEERFNQVFFSLLMLLVLVVTIKEVIALF